MMKLAAIVSISLLLNGCMLWPYKSDFDCAMPKGEHCQSLYAINKLADQGKFYVDVNKTEPNCSCKSKSKRKGKCRHYKKTCKKL